MFVNKFTADSTYDVATEPPTLPMSHKTFPKSNTVRQIITSIGGWLKLQNASIALLIPETAIGKQSKQNIFLSILNEDSITKVCIPEICTHLSPIIHCGPPDVTFNKPVILRIPHCAEHLNNWRISLYYSSAHIQDMEPKWRKLITLGEETINTPAYVQMDDKNAYIMTEFLGRYALIGESLIPNGMGAIKRLKLFLFGPTVQPVSTECSIRVYVIEDFPSSKEYCCNLESRLGGTFLGSSQQSLLFQDNGQDLYLSIKCCGGWKSKIGAESQKIPFSHVWNNSLALHCAFTIERNDQHNVAPALKIEVQARQRQGGEVTVLHVAPFLLNDLTTSTTASSGGLQTTPLLQQQQQQSQQQPPLSVIDEYSDGSVRSITLSDKNHNYIIQQQQQDSIENTFKLTRQIKRELSACLDPPTQRGNDWRMLAQKLNTDRYIAYFATKPSPTEHILDLWECRNRETSSLAELTTILRNMGRIDAIEIFEKTLGPSWL